MNTKERHEQTLAMIACYERGESLREIAKRYGVTSNAVKQRLVGYKVKLRPAKMGRPKKASA